MNKLTAQNFDPFLKQKFQLRDIEGLFVEAELTEVNRVKVKPEEVSLRERKEPFSIVIRIDDSFQLPQGTYRIEFPGMGELAIFFVPIGKDEQYRYYEAVFN